MKKNKNSSKIVLIIILIVSIISISNITKKEVQGNIDYDRAEYLLEEVGGSVWSTDECYSSTQGDFFPGYYKETRNCFCHQYPDENACKSAGFPKRVSDYYDTPDSCYSSDNKDIYNKGYVSGWEDGYDYKEYDECISSTQVREFYCDGDYNEWNTYTCQYGCSNGACNTQSTTTTTTTTTTTIEPIEYFCDGRDFYGSGDISVKGNTYIFQKYDAEPSNTDTYTDYCVNDNTVREYYCTMTDNDYSYSKSSLYSSSDISCPSGQECVDGACVDVRLYFCAESDNNYENKGTLYIIPEFGEDWETYEDYCVDDDTVYEYYCIHDDTYYSANKDELYYTGTYSCTGDKYCLNGECVLPATTTTTQESTTTTEESTTTTEESNTTTEDTATTTIQESTTTTYYTEPEDTQSKTQLILLIVGIVFVIFVTQMGRKK
jgi:hypothetical protein